MQTQISFVALGIALAMFGSRALTGCGKTGL